MQRAGLIAKRVKQHYREQKKKLRIIDKDLAHFFEDTCSEIAELDNERVDIAPAEESKLVQLASNIILHELRALLEKESIAGNELKITPENFAELLVLLHHKKIGSNAVVPMLEEMQRTGDRKSTRLNSSHSSI